MSNTVKTWQSGDVITDNHLNNLTDVAKHGGSSIIISDSQPNDTDNSVWINTSNSNSEIEVPAIKDLENIVVSKYSSSSTYGLNSYVLHADANNEYKIYKCNTIIGTPEAWNSSKWTVTSLTEIINSLSNSTNSTTTQLDTDIRAINGALAALSNVIADAYSTSRTYAVGEYAMNPSDGKLYRCKTAITTAEAWNSAHWEETTVMQEIISLLQ